MYNAAIKVTYADGQVSTSVYDVLFPTVEGCMALLQSTAAEQLFRLYNTRPFETFELMCSLAKGML